MNRFILAYAKNEKYLFSYDLKNLDNVEESMQTFEISNGDSSNLLFVRCSGKNCFIYDCEKHLFYI